MNWETKFGLWVKNHGVANLCRDLDVTKNAVYHWIAGRAEPKKAHCLKIIELSSGAVSLQDICDHARAVQAEDPALT